MKLTRRSEYLYGDRLSLYGYLSYRNNARTDGHATRSSTTGSSRYSRLRTRNPAKRKTFLQSRKIRSRPVGVAAWFFSPFRQTNRRRGIRKRKSIANNNAVVYGSTSSDCFAAEETPNGPKFVYSFTHTTTTCRATNNAYVSPFSFVL